MKSGFCVLWGRPNAGKSTLLNALLGRKHVIVSPRPQTTRHRIAGVLNGEDYQIVFLDTPGIHLPKHKLGESLVKAARSALDDIECLIFVADASDAPHDDDERAAAMLKNQQAPVLLALNKMDAARTQTIDWPERRAAFENLFSFQETIEISALEGEGIGVLREAIIARLPAGEPYFPPEMLGDRSPEFHVAELIREQAMLQLREEVPHSVAVGIEQLAPRPNGVLYIEALLYIERESQKHIIIGKGGARIKEIGKVARAEIEALMERSIYLDLRVKVRDKWRDSEMWVQRLGYDD